MRTPGPLHRHWGPLLVVAGSGAILLALGPRAGRPTAAAPAAAPSTTGSSVGSTLETYPRGRWRLAEWADLNRTVL